MSEPLALPAPIFIVGAARSGTTLTSKILGRHPDIAAPGESHFFEDIWTRRHELGPLETEAEVAQATARLKTLYGRYNFPETQSLVEQVLDERRLVREVLAAGGGYAALYTCFMSLLAEAMGKQRFCDDTPKHLFHLPDILRLFPAAKIIGCVRDPRDFLCSYKNYWRRSTESDRIRALYHPVLTASLWRSSAGLLADRTEQFGPSNMTLVKYEQLVNDPQREVRRLCAFLDAPFSSELLKVESQNSSFSDTVEQGIFTGSVGRWRNCLTVEETWWSQTLCRRQMQQFDYSPEHVPVAFWRAGLTLLTVPLAALRALYANRHKRGPLGPYLYRRVVSLLTR